MNTWKGKKDEQVIEHMEMNTWIGKNCQKRCIWIHSLTPSKEVQTPEEKQKLYFKQKIQVNEITIIPCLVPESINF